MGTTFQERVRPPLAAREGEELLLDLEGTRDYNELYQLCMSVNARKNHLVCKFARGVAKYESV